MSKYHMSVAGSPAGCVAVVRSCPRGGEESYLRSIGVEGPARATVKELRESQERFYDKHGLDKETDTIEKVIDISDMSDGEKTKLATDPNTSPEILKALSKDGDVDSEYEVRMDVGRNPNTPEETLSEMVDDKQYRVRKGVAQNPNLSRAMITKLIKRDGVQAIKDWRYGSRSKYGEARRVADKELYDNDQARWGDEIEKVIDISDMSYGEKAKIATDPNTSPETLKSLSKDGDYEVRMDVGRNPNTPEETLSEMVDDKQFRVRRGIAQNPNLSRAMITKLIKRDGVQAIKDWRYGSRSKYGEVRRVADKELYDNDQARWGDEIEKVIVGE